MFSFRWDFLGLIISQIRKLGGSYLEIGHWLKWHSRQPQSSTASSGCTQASLLSFGHLGKELACTRKPETGGRSKGHEVPTKEN